MDEIGDSGYIDQEEYKKDEYENWDLRPDVAGYEYPDEGLNWRLGIVRDLVDSPKQLAAVRDILNTPFTDDLTRNMARVVITHDLLRNPPLELQPLLSELEVLIPLKDSGNEELADCYQAVFSRNSASRQTPPETIAQEIASCAKVFHEGQAKRVANKEISLPGDIKLQKLSSESDSTLINGFIEQVSVAFAEEDAELMEQVQDEDAIVLVATTEYEGKSVVIGSVYAYKDADIIRRDGKDIELSTFEITGAKVKEGMEGKGIYKALQVKLLQELAAKDDVDVVVGYSNTQSLGVLSVAGQMGRSIVIDAAAELGLPIRPAMKQTVTDEQLVDEIVTYIPGNTLRAEYGSK